MLNITHGIEAPRGSYHFASATLPIALDMGLDAKMVEYGEVDWYEARFRMDEIAEILYFNSEDGDSYIGHSNAGAALWTMQQETDRILQGVVLVQPALDRNRRFRNVDFLHVYYNPLDYATFVSALLRFNHPWGMAGTFGMSYETPNLTQWNTRQLDGFRFGGHIHHDEKKWEPFAKFFLSNWQIEFNRRVSSDLGW